MAALLASGALIYTPAHAADQAKQQTVKPAAQAPAGSKQKVGEGDPDQGRIATKQQVGEGNPDQGRSDWGKYQR